MRSVLFASLLLCACSSRSTAPAESRIVVDPQAAARLQMRLGKEPAAVFSSEMPSVGQPDPRRAAHARGFRADVPAKVRQ